MNFKHLYCSWKVARHAGVLLATEAVKLAFEYADEMIMLGAELDQVLAELALHRIDLVISDTPMPSNIDVKAYSQLNWWRFVYSRSVFDYIC
jgi:hypothetical protein